MRATHAGGRGVPIYALFEFRYDQRRARQARGRRRGAARGQQVLSARTARSGRGEPHNESFRGARRFAEFETNLRRERRLEGIVKTKAAGVYKGRRVD